MIRGGSESKPIRGGSESKPIRGGSESKPCIVVDARMVGLIPHGIARYVTQIAHSLGTLSGQHSLSYDLIFLVRPGFSKEFLRESFAGFQTHEVAAPFLSLAELWEIPQV